MSDRISDEALAAMRGRTGAWPKNSAECNALIARLDAAESKLDLAEAVIEAARPLCPGRAALTVALAAYDRALSTTPEGREDDASV